MGWAPKGVFRRSGGAGLHSGGRSPQSRRVTVRCSRRPCRSDRRGPSNIRPARLQTRRICEESRANRHMWSCTRIVVLVQRSVGGLWCAGDGGKYPGASSESRRAASESRSRPPSYIRWWRRYWWAWTPSAEKLRTHSPSRNNRRPSRLVLLFWTRLGCGAGRWVFDLIFFCWL